MGMKNEEHKRPPKSILYYYGIVSVSKTHLTQPTKSIV